MLHLVKDKIPNGMSSEASLESPLLHAAFFLQCTTNKNLPKKTGEAVEINTLLMNLTTTRVS